MEKKVALITGGIRGIGAEICKKMASEGYFVYINYRNETSENENLLNEIKEAGGDAELICFDVCNDNDVQAALKGMKHKKLDLLVNNAGYLKDELIYKIDMNIWHKVLDTNYFAAVRLFEQFKGKLLSVSTPTVVSIGSISGIKPRAGQTAYAASKAMLIEWTMHMAKLYDNRINFYSVSPGPVNTEMIQNTKWRNNPEALKRIPLGRFIEPKEIAEIVCLLGKSGFVKNGSNIVYDGGFINTVRE